MADGSRKSIPADYDPFDDDTIFIQPPDDDYHCAICLRLVQRNPHLTKCCGNHFCHECVSPLVHSYKSCPLCNHDPPVEIFPNQRQKRAINQLAVRCPKKLEEDAKCEWEGTFGDLPGHIKEKHPPPTPKTPTADHDSLAYLLSQNTSSFATQDSSPHAHAQYWTAATPQGTGSLFYCQPLMSLNTTSQHPPVLPPQSLYSFRAPVLHPHLQVPLHHGHHPMHHPPPHRHHPNGPPPHHPPPPYHPHHAYPHPLHPYHPQHHVHPHPPHRPPPPHHAHPPHHARPHPPPW